MEVSGLLAVLLATVTTTQAWPHETRSSYSLKPSEHVSESHQYTSHQPTTRRAMENDDGIVFPNDNCLRKIDDDICESAANYPYEHIRKIVERSNLKNAFGAVQGTLVSQETRGGAAASDLQSVCASEGAVVYPQQMKNLDKVQKLIINDEALFKQGVYVEKCKSNATGKSDNSCGNVDLFPQGYKTKCHQNYATVRLLAVSPNNTSKVEQDTFAVPCCCVCKYSNK